jgi:hypothetical protein
VGVNVRVALNPCPFVDGVLAIILSFYGAYEERMYSYEWAEQFHDHFGDQYSSQRRAFIEGLIGFRRLFEPVKLRHLIATTTDPIVKSFAVLCHPDNHGRAVDGVCGMHCRCPMRSFLEGLTDEQLEDLRIWLNSQKHGHRTLVITHSKAYHD